MRIAKKWLPVLVAPMCLATWPAGSAWGQPAEVPSGESESGAEMLSIDQEMLAGAGCAFDGECRDEVFVLPRVYRCDDGALVVEIEE